MLAVAKTAGGGAKDMLADALKKLSPSFRKTRRRDFFHGKHPGGLERAPSSPLEHGKAA